MPPINLAVRVVLSEGTDRVDQLIGYTCRKLNSYNQSYATIERECLAIKWEVEYLQYYLLGQGVYFNN